jgi:3-phosphoshikimate 1-carboxyvinyltransferase
MQPIAAPFQSKFTPPGSKSLTNRALVLGALADGVSNLSNVLFADDTLVMIECLIRLGFTLKVDHERHFVQVFGQGGRIGRDSAELFCGNSGTSLRFLTALCALGKGIYTLDGIARMRQRPIGQLVEMLKNLAVRIDYVLEAGFPPIRVLAEGIAGGILQFGTVQSSQYLSAVLLAAPYARHELQFDLQSPQTSWPYVAMTMQLMDHFGVTPELVRDPDTREPRRIIVPREKYRATDYTVEPDASNASYFLAAAAIHEGAKITIEGLGKQSLQGDVRFADVLHSMGADLVFGKDFLTILGTGRLEGIEVDLADMPDTAQTLAAIAVFAKGETVIHGLHTLRVKETDRLAALQNELTKLGAEVEIEDGSLIITPPASVRRAQIETYDDHRMAMSFAIVGTKAAGITIRDAECVNKTYPGFFEDLERVTAGEKKDELA